MTEVVPERCLFPDPSPTTYVLPTFFLRRCIDWVRTGEFNITGVVHGHNPGGLDTADYCLKHIDELAKCEQK